jgi:hypothetical protein
MDISREHQHAKATRARGLRVLRGFFFATFVKNLRA